jgi:hypothetical protein
MNKHPLRLSSQLRRRSALLLLCLSCLAASAQNRKIRITGNVYSEQALIGLVGAKVYLIDPAGAVVDSTTASMGVAYGNVMVKKPKYSFQVDQGSGTYTIEATYPNYEPGYQSFNSSEVGKREVMHELPDIHLMRTVSMSKEVVVTASKVKFYNNGDTLIYRADAFQLADGSMLDALIRQMPGVELKENGQIYVNGKFVESLMLNGREFVGKDNHLLLENLGAYTIKNIAVYDKQSEREKFLGRAMGETQFVMDVRMKKEFIGTYLVNLEAGYGTEERYMGRAFGMRSSATSQVMLMGAVNNVNDTRRPGEATSWTPENMVSGLHKEKLLRADYIFNAPDHSWRFSGNTIFKHSTLDDETYTNRILFLQGGDNYAYDYNGTKGKNLWLGTAASYSRTLKNLMLLTDATVQYVDVRNKQSYTAATLTEQHDELSSQAIKEIYGIADPSLIGSIVNRNLQEDSTANKTLRVFGNITPTIKIPNTNDALFMVFHGEYTHETPTVYNNQSINYGADATPAYDRTQYFENSPRHSYMLGAEMDYTYWFTGGYIQPIYKLSFEEKVKDSRLYALDRLADQGVYGTLPAEFEQYLDNNNSYRGTHRQLSNSLGFILAFKLGKLAFQLAPNVRLFRQTLDYEQGGMSRNPKRTSLLFESSSTHVYYRLGEYRGTSGMAQYKHSFDLELKASGTTPDMSWLVDIPYTANPLNTYEGTDKLSNEQRLDLSLTYSFLPKGSRLMESVILRSNFIDNALVRGYRYDTQTGVRTIRSYNVDGNKNFGVTNSLSVPVGRVMLSSSTAFDYGHVADMIGTDCDPTPYRIKNMFVTEQLQLQYAPAKWLSLTAKTDVQWRKTMSSETNFNEISAVTSNTGVTALVKLPARFQVSTDATLYARNGYGSPELDTKDWVWNARLSWTTKKRDWLFAVDGFDLLKQLSSVNYAVNAQGRTVTYSNVLPRYLMFHVQYKFNYLPKRKL